MTRKFKVGDQITFIPGGSYSGYFNPEAIYTVSEILIYAEKPTIKVAGVMHQFYEEQFKMYEDPSQDNQFVRVTRENIRMLEI